MTRLQTPPCRASYPKLFEPEIHTDQQKGKVSKVYQITLLVEDTPEGNEFLKKAEALAEEAGRAKFGNRYDALIKTPTFKRAIRYDVDKYKDVTPPVKAFINARSYDTPPGVVGIYPDPKDPTKPAKITDPSLVYPGVYIKASLHAYATDRTDSKSVSLGLGNVQVLTHMNGARIDSRVAAEDEFTADPQAAANLDDLWMPAPSTIKPTIGRKVWFWNATVVGVRDAAQPWDATIHFVHDDDAAGVHVVDLTVIDHYGVAAIERGITLRDPATGDAHATGRRYATWMPFQVGQAKKA